MQEEKGGEELETKVRKLRQETEKNNLKGLVIDRTKSNEEIPNRIDIMANEFQGLGGNRESANGMEEEAIPGHLDGWNPFCERAMGIRRKEGRPGMGRVEMATQWEIEMCLSWGDLLDKIW